MQSTASNRAVEGIGRQERAAGRRGPPRRSAGPEWPSGILRVGRGPVVSRPNMPACHAGDRRFESGRVRHLPRGKLPAHVSKGRSGEDYSLTHDEVLAPAVALEDDDIELAAMVTIGKALNALQP